jgi:hypothetical protein
MLIVFAWIWKAYPPRLRSKGFQIRQSGHPEGCRTSDAPLPFTTALSNNAIDVFDRSAFTHNPLNPSDLRKGLCADIGATPSSSLAACLKTSFSRLDPIPRGQATVIRSSSRGILKHQQHGRTTCAVHPDDPERQASFLPPSPPSLPAG